jgi:hypothetical protein
LRAAIESARDQRVLHVRYPHDGSKTYQIGDTAKVLNRFDSETAVLSIDKRPLESSRGVYPSHFRRSKLRHARAELQLAVLERLPYGVILHLLDGDD